MFCRKGLFMGCGKKLVTPLQVSFMACFPSACNPILFRITQPIQRIACSSLQNRKIHGTTESQGTRLSFEELKSQDWKIVYRFRYIQPLRLVSRMKIYQTAFTIVALPPMAYLNSTGDVADLQLQAAVGVATFAGFMLYICSNYIRKCVSLLSLNSTKDIVRVSHLTFWGKRQDLYIPVQDVVPYSELPDEASDIYIKFKTYDQRTNLFLSVRYGILLNKEDFFHIVGHVPLS